MAHVSQPDNRTSVLTNDEVQRILGDAEQYLATTLKAQSAAVTLDSPILELCLALIRAMRIHSASGNGIPGYRGQGLNETVDLAKKILELKPYSDHTLNIRSFKEIALAITLGGRS